MLSAALGHAGRHPDLVRREDYLLTGIFRMLRTLTLRLAPGSDVPRDVVDLGTGWLSDMVQLSAAQMEQIERSRQPS